MGTDVKDQALQQRPLPLPPPPPQRFLGKEKKKKEEQQRRADLVFVSFPRRFDFKCPPRVLF